MYIQKQVTTQKGLTMVMITKLIMLGIAVVCAVTLAFILLDFVTDKVKSTPSKKRNQVHFYVARDMNGTIWLYMGKPKRDSCSFVSSGLGLTLPSRDFSRYGLNANDYANLKWEDEPVEVFLNMGD